MNKANKKSDVWLLIGGPTKMGSKRTKFWPKKCRRRFSRDGRPGRPIEKKREHNHADSINALRAIFASSLDGESGGGEEGSQIRGLSSASDGSVFALKDRVDFAISKIQAPRRLPKKKRTKKGKKKNEQGINFFRCLTFRWGTKQSCLTHLSHQNYTFKFKYTPCGNSELLPTIMCFSLKKYV